MLARCRCAAVRGERDQNNVHTRMTDQTGGGVVLIESLPEGRTTAVCWVVV